MSTLLQIVNRVRGKIRQDPLSGLSTTDPDQVVLVDLVNEAKREVLEHHDWDFDIRHDGVVKLVGEISYTLGIIVADATTMIISGATDKATFSGDKVARIIVEEDPAFGQTAFIASDVSSFAGADQYTFSPAFPGTTNGTADVRVFCSEYLLPTTVRDVLVFRDEENTISPTLINKLTHLDPSVPNPHLISSSYVDQIYVGGWYTETTLDGATAQDARLGFMVHPVPSATKLLQYTYRYRHPALVVAADALNIPAHVEDLIVDKAVTKAQMSSVANDPGLAVLNAQDISRRTANAAAHSNPTPMRRRSMRSHDRSTRSLNTGSRPSDPTNFGSG